DADRQNFGVMVPNLIERLLDERQLARADRRPIGRIKSKDHILSAIIAQLHRPLIAAQKGEIARRLVRCLFDRHRSSSADLILFWTFSFRSVYILILGRSRAGDNSPSERHAAGLRRSIG